jgi:hypothetical protein
MYFFLQNIIIFLFAAMFDNRDQVGHAGAEGCSAGFVFVRGVRTTAKPKKASPYCASRKACFELRAGVKPLKRHAH